MSFKPIQFSGFYRVSIRADRDIRTVESKVNDFLSQRATLESTTVPDSGVTMMGDTLNFSVPDTWDNGTQALLTEERLDFSYSPD